MKAIEFGRYIETDPDVLKARMYDKLAEMIQNSQDVKQTVDAFEFVLEELGVNDGNR